MREGLDTSAVYNGMNRPIRQRGKGRGWVGLVHLPTSFGSEIFYSSEFVPTYPLRSLPSLPPFQIANMLTDTNVSARDRFDVVRLYIWLLFRGPPIAGVNDSLLSGCVEVVKFERGDLRFRLVSHFWRSKAR